MKHIRLFIAIMALTIAAGCTSGWTAAERELIEGQPAVMRVLTVEDESDLEVLRTPCRDFSAKELADPFTPLWRRKWSLL